MTDDYSRLLTKTSLALLLAAALVALCYFLVDQPVAYYVHDHGIGQETPVFRWLTYPPPDVQAIAPAILVALAIGRAFGSFKRWQLVLLTACVSVIVADQFRQSLSFVFGRYWPETWTHDNPSLIGSDAYGFHPFHWGVEYGSFPSGHMARTVGAAAVVWLAYPRWRAACILVALAIAVGLIGMNYHFVGDVIAGSFVGGIVGVYATRLADIRGAGFPACRTRENT